MIPKAETVPARHVTTAMAAPFVIDVRSGAKVCFNSHTKYRTRHVVKIVKKSPVMV